MNNKFFVESRKCIWIGEW